MPRLHNQNAGQLRLKKCFKICLQERELTADLLSVLWVPAFLLVTLQADQPVQPPHLVLPHGTLLQHPAHHEVSIASEVTLPSFCCKVSFPAPHSHLRVLAPLQQCVSSNKVLHGVNHSSRVCTL